MKEFHEAKEVMELNEMGVCLREIGMYNHYGCACQKCIEEIRQKLEPFK